MDHITKYDQEDAHHRALLTENDTPYNHNDIQKMLSIPANRKWYKRKLRKMMELTEDHDPIKNHMKELMNFI